jgi:hypothetical protein
LKASQANSSQGLSQKKNASQKRAGGMAQGVSPEFKPQYYQKKKRWHLDKNNDKKKWHLDKRRANDI